MASTSIALLTFAEFERLPDPPDGRYELHHGEIVKMPPPFKGHKVVMRNLRRLLEVAADDSWIVDDELGFRVGDSNYRVPDIAVVAASRWDATASNEHLSGAPELVAEILSESNTASEIFDKEQICLENGALEFWVVDPTRAQVKVTTKDGHTHTYKSADEIPLFFGGTIPVAPISAR